MVCLAFRHNNSHHLLGRETFLAPVRWDKNAWPVVNGDGTIALQMDVPTLPQQPVAKAPVRTTFGSGKLGHEWVYVRNPRMENYAFEGGKLRLKAVPVPIEEMSKNSPTFVLRRQEHIDFTATTSLQLHKASAGDEAGLSVYAFETSFYNLSVKQLADGRQAVRLRYHLNSIDHVEKEAVLPKGCQEVQLRVKGDKDLYVFSYSTDGKQFTPLAKVDTRYLSTETAGGFTGVMLGMFAVSASANSKACAQATSKVSKYSVRSYS